MPACDTPHSPSAQKVFISRPDGICPVFMDNIADCHHSVCTLESIKRALYLCVKNYDHCGVYRKWTREH